ncbi:MAG: hypothetical protein L3J39_08430 [Verrucomicrobiales bacterium]|nr:hypothetical protein [Verrucomicrobiales bacterium]
MARRKSSGAEISLFPFLSILVCVIGCLTMIIVFINLIQMNKGEGKEPKEIEVAKEYVELKKQQEKDKVKLDKLRQLVENLIQNQEDLRAKREKLNRLKELLASNEQIDSLRDELIAKLNLLMRTNKKLDKDKVELLAEVEKLEKEIKKRKLPPKIAALRVQSSGSASNIEPYFVEIADKTVLIHTSLTEPPVEFPSASLKQNKDFLDLLKKIGEKPYRKLIFLVRGNSASVANFKRANSTVSTFNRATGAEILPGKLPLPGEGKVDLSVFAKFLKK